MSEPTTQEQAPAWEEITPTLIELIHGDDDKMAQQAMVELRRMAKLADRMRDFVPALQVCFAALQPCTTDACKAAARMADLVLGGGSLQSSPPQPEEKSNIILLNRFNA
jgi:hypothetical protein